MANKPSGTAGPYKVTRTPEGGVTSGQVKIAWSPVQKEIERKILGYFVRERERVGAKSLKIEDGGTEELDFLLTLPGGKSYLELMEAVVPPIGELPHQPGQLRYDPIPYADTIFREVNKKIKKYGFNHKIPIELLIYITHEQYNPNQAAIQVLRRYFKERPHPFASVFFMTPLAEDLTPMEVLFNRGYSFHPPPLDELAGRWWINLPSSNFVLRCQKT